MITRLISWRQQTPFGKLLFDCSFQWGIANLDAKIYDRSANKLCTLIDDSYFDVEFSILEAEIEEVTKGQHVKIIPFINDEKTFYGDVTEIIP